MKRVGIVTMHKVVNYGSALQAWATQEVIRRLGYDVLIIDYVYPNAFHIKDKKRNIARSVLQWCLHFCQGFPWEKKRNHFEKFWNDNFNLTQTYPCVESIYNNPPDFDVYVAGSDQIWNPTCIKGDGVFLLDFVTNGKRRFVQNIDVNYAGMVKARNEVFLTQDLTEKTHYIASTGIGGRHPDPQVTVQMDAYAINGIQPAQIQFLYATTHLNPTYEYGVSFERGTCVKYGDRRQVFISGTASINNKGEVVYPGDVRKQTNRMWENVEALLKEAECSFDDVSQAIIYLRDPADYTIVKELFDNKFPHLPHVMVHAPVCRPKWLIEMECIAVKSDKNDKFKDF